MEPKPIVELHTFWASYWWTVTTLDTLDTSIRNNSLQSVHLELLLLLLVSSLLHSRKDEQFARLLRSYNKQTYINAIKKGIVKLRF